MLNNSIYIYTRSTGVNLWKIFYWNVAPFFIASELEYIHSGNKLAEGYLCQHNSSFLFLHAVSCGRFTDLREYEMQKGDSKRGLECYEIAEVCLFLLDFM